MAQRRPRAATEEKRKRLLDATEELMLKDGYAAVSSRSVAAAVGIQAPLVHYYFPTLDDLFVAVLQRRAGPERRAHGRGLRVTRAAAHVVAAGVGPEAARPCSSSCSPPPTIARRSRPRSATWRDASARCRWSS